MEIITAKWYQENAIRTLKDFGSLELTKFNAYMGIIGEYGEFFDYMKKLYTHGLSPEKKEEVRKLVPKELGDMIWYIATSLRVAYNYELDDIVEYITLNYSYQRNIVSDIYGEDNSYNMDLIHSYTDLDENQNPLELLMDYKRALNKLDNILNNPDNIIEVLAEVLVKTATIVERLFHKTLSEILKDNIDKLKKRYPEGFSEQIANTRIDRNKKYREETDHKAILQKKSNNH